MFSKYLLTGATGFLGNTIAWMLHEKGIECVCFVVKGDRHASKLPPSVKIVYGDVLDFESISEFFEEKDDNTCLLHCAGIVSIASKRNPDIYNVNVRGTINILSKALEHNIKKVIYVSSIHAIPPKTKNEVMTELSYFDKDLVKGDYAKSKAIASNYAIEYSRFGLDISIVHPAGLIGPRDFRAGEMTNLITEYLKGNLRFASKGGNNFVDVRDAAMGILKCAEAGKKGECYLLTGHNHSIKHILEEVRKRTKGKRIIYLPLWLVRRIAPIHERMKVKKGEKSYLTPYSAYALGINSNFSSLKAIKEFGYAIRPIEKTLKDTVYWLRIHEID